MPNRFDFGGVDLTAGENPSGARPSDETPFCLAILGDFSGRASRGVADSKTVGDRRPVLVDRDNFDQVMAGMKVELHLPTAEHAPIAFRFSDLDDFHPDRLFEHPGFAKLRGLRERMQNPATFSEVAEELGLSSTRLDAPEPSAVEAPSRPPSAMQLASGSLLDDMIEQTEARASEPPSRGKKDEVREFARQIAAKYAVSAPDPRRPEFVAAVDRAVSDVMRMILHNPQFQAIEAIWRATFLLVRQLETGSRLKLYLIDISKDELAADLASSSDPRSTGTFRLLVEKGILTPGADPWAVIVGNYSFGPSPQDVELLSRIAKVANRAGSPFLAEADSRLLGATALAETPNPQQWMPIEEQGPWAHLRRSPESDSVGLALPRFLLRLPYGEKTSPTDAFDFEEFPGSPEHEGYLWGNPAFAIGLLFAQSFSESGWGMRPGTISQIDKLPLHIYSASGESIVKPCAEVLFTEDAVQAILENGLIPLVSYKGRDSVRVARFQSIAEPPRPPAGRWAA